MNLDKGNTKQANNRKITISDQKISKTVNPTSFHRH